MTAVQHGRKFYAFDDRFRAGTLHNIDVDLRKRLFSDTDKYRTASASLRRKQLIVLAHNVAGNVEVKRGDRRIFGKSAQRFHRIVLVLFECKTVHGIRTLIVFGL